MADDSAVPPGNLSAAAFEPPQWMRTDTMTDEVREWFQKVDDAEQFAFIRRLHDWASYAIEVNALAKVKKRNPSITPSLIEDAIHSRKRKMLALVRHLPFMGMDPPAFKLVVFRSHVTVRLTAVSQFDTTSVKALQRLTPAYVPSIRYVEYGLVPNVCKRMTRHMWTLDVNSIAGEPNDSGYDTGDEFEHEPMSDRECCTWTSGVIGGIILVVALLYGVLLLCK